MKERYYSEEDVVLYANKLNVVIQKKIIEKCSSLEKGYELLTYKRKNKKKGMDNDLPCTSGSVKTLISKLSSDDISEIRSLGKEFLDKIKELLGDDVHKKALIFNSMYLKRGVTSAKLMSVIESSFDSRKCSLEDYKRTTKDRLLYYPVVALLVSLYDSPGGEVLINWFKSYCSEFEEILNSRSEDHCEFFIDPAKYNWVAQKINSSEIANEIVAIVEERNITWSSSPQEILRERKQFKDKSNSGATIIVKSEKEGPCYFLRKNEL